MKTIYNIARVELKQLFCSPVAWMVVTMFAIQLGMKFCPAFLGHVLSQEAGHPLQWGLTSLFFNSPTQGLFGEALRHLYLYIPLITMGLMSREVSNGTIKLLYSSPVSNMQIILGKYMSVVIFGLMLMGVMLLYVILGAFTVESMDFPLVLSGLLGVYLVICTYSAIGLFMSNLTSYQIVAALFTFATLMVLSYVSSWWQEYDIVRDITWWLSINGRAETFLFGLLCTEDFIYFLVVIAMFLGFTYIKLNGARAKVKWYTKMGRYLGVLAAVMAIGYFTSLPKMRAFVDVTETKGNTLNKSSQEIMKHLDGKLTITTYVNILADGFQTGTPKYRKRDINRFKRYIRFKPDIEFKYKFYYADAGNAVLDEIYPNSTLRQKMVKFANSYSLDTAMFMSPEEMSKIEDLKPEGYRFVRKLSHENGKETFLRIYDDPEAFPREAEISAALKRISMALPRVGFLVSHGERSSVREGGRDYNRFSWDKMYRHALINNGFEIDEVTLTSKLPDDMEILIISDMKTALTEEELVNYKEFVDRGGNIFILGAPTRQDNMNPLLEGFGVRFMPGQLIQLSDHHDANIVTASMTKEAGELTYFYEALFYNQQYTLPMPACVGIEYVETKGYKVTPVLSTPTTKSWNELQTTDFIDEKVTLDVTSGEIEKPNITGIALTRDVKGKEQRVLILGDADCISNLEMGRVRAGIKSMNLTFLNGTFFWLSNDQLPIDGRRPSGSDDAMKITEGPARAICIFLNWVFPFILLISSIVIWVRRRNR